MTLFILLPGTWLGQGTLEFTGVKDIVSYYTKWIIEPLVDGEIRAKQIVELQDVPEKLQNSFRFFSFGSEGFQVEMTNEIVGKVTAQGFLTEMAIGWQFPGGEHFKGLEVYERQTDGIYHCYAHYESPDQITTTIEGKIWEKIATH